VGRSDVEAALRALQRARVEEAVPRDGVRATGRAPARTIIDLDNWRGAALAVAAMITLAVLLALWLF
jgi:anti-sigma-K factor RskA